MLSIIIPVYNQTVNLLETSVISAITQFGLEKEIIIVDDGSTDGCVEKIFVNNRQFLENQVKIIKKENGGVGSALNKGIEESKYDYIAWLSSDDYFYPEKSIIQLINMQSVDALFSFTGFRQLTRRCGKIVSMIDYPMPFQSGLIAQNRLHQSLLSRFPSSYLNGATVIMHRSIIDKVGGFKTDLKHMQDYEMWLRISKQFSGLCCRDILIVKNLHENQMRYMDTDESFKQHRETEEATLKGLYL